MLSVRIRNSVMHSCPQKVTSLYSSPKVTYPERLYGEKIMKIRAIEDLTLWRETVCDRIYNSAYLLLYVQPATGKITDPFYVFPAVRTMCVKQAFVGSLGHA
jgi:hypothetical protein